MIKFLDLKKVTASHAEEIHEAVARVVDSGWYLLGNEVKNFEELCPIHWYEPMCRCGEWTGCLDTHLPCLY